MDGAITRSCTRGKVSQIDIVARTIRLEVGTTKNKEGRFVPMTPDLYALLAAYVHGKNPSDHVFTRNGKPVKNCKGCGRLPVLLPDVRVD